MKSYIREISGGSVYTILRKRKCPYCKTFFFPNHKLKKRQITCGKEYCKRLHKKYLNSKKLAIQERSKNNEDWRKNNKEKIKKYNQIYYKTKIKHSDK